MAGAATGGDPTLLDEVAGCFPSYKDDDEVTAELRKLSLPNADKMIDALLEIRFDKFHALSLKALRNIVPHMEAGLRYDEACAQAGYHHSQLLRSRHAATQTYSAAALLRPRQGRSHGVQRATSTSLATPLCCAHSIRRAR
ncbi:MAG: hypothetical protein U5L03_04305 [Burkholderiaceae bacterium]|nr:hypothetical protein [Burkholderiaceae bacterium]